MSVTASQFRTDFPVFADTTAYPDTAVNMWLALANANLDAGRWGNMLTLGAELWTAHNLVIDARDRNAGVPGQISGPVASKSIDKVSVGYDTGSVMIEGAGDYNLTTYGIRYARLAAMIGAGGYQV